MKSTRRRKWMAIPREYSKRVQTPSILRSFGASGKRSPAQQADEDWSQERGGLSATSLRNLISALSM
jgi:hypothetical protein